MTFLLTTTEQHFWLTCSHVLLLSQAAGGPKERSEGAQRHLGILLFGDSIDYRIARSFCNAALGHGLEHMSDDDIAIHHNLTGAIYRL